MSRVIDFIDGVSSATSPVTAALEAGKLAVFASDAAYETDKGAVGSGGDLYFSSTTNDIRFYDPSISSWKANEAELNNSTTSSPGISNDQTEGYEVGSIWVNTSTGSMYRCVDASTGAAIWTEIASNSLLDAHTTASANVHGVGAGNDVVGTGTTQTLTAKTLTSPDINGGTIDGAAIATSTYVPYTDTTANLTTYANLGTHNGELVRSSDELLYYQIEASLLTAIAGGGGGSAVYSTYATLDADTNAYGDWVSTGLTNATWSEETTNHISGDASYKLTNHASAAAEYVVSENLDVPERSVNRMTWLELAGLYPASGTDSAISLILEANDSGWAELPESEVFVEANDTVKSYVLQGFLSSTVTQIRVKVVVEVGEAKDFIFSDIAFKDQAVNVRETIETQSVQYYGYTGYGSTNNKIPYFATEVENVGNDIVTVANDSTNGFSLTALKDCEVNASITTTTGGAGVYVGWSLNSTQLTTTITSITTTDARGGIAYTGSGNDAVSPSPMIKMSEGDILRVHTGGVALAGNTVVSVSATATANNVVLAAEAGSQVIYHTANASTFLDSSGNVRFDPSNLTLDGPGDLFDIVDNAGGTQTEFTAKVDLLVHTANMSCTFSADNNRVGVYRAGTTEIMTGTGGDAGTYTGHASGFILKAGEFFTFAGTGAYSGSPVFVNITASPTRSNFALALPFNAQSKSADTVYQGFAGYGSSNLSIVHFTSELKNTASEFYTTDNSTSDGFSLTILKDVKLNIDYTQYGSGSAGTYAGLSLNSTQLDTTINSVTVTDVLDAAVFNGAGTDSKKTSVERNFTAGDVIRAHSWNSSGGHTGTLTQITISVTPTVMNHFVELASQKVAYLSNETTSDIASVNNAAKTCAVNTLSGDTSFISIDSDQITLQPGEFKYDINNSVYRPGSYQIYLYNITDAAIEKPGDSGYSHPTYGGEMKPRVVGSLSLSVVTTFEVRMYTDDIHSQGMGYGTAAAAGNPLSNRLTLNGSITKLIGQ